MTLSSISELFKTAINDTLSIPGEETDWEVNNSKIILRMPNETKRQQSFYSTGGAYTHGKWVALSPRERSYKRYALLSDTILPILNAAGVKASLEEGIYNKKWQSSSPNPRYGDDSYESRTNESRYEETGTGLILTIDVKDDPDALKKMQHVALRCKAEHIKGLISTLSAEVTEITESAHVRESIMSDIAQHLQGTKEEKEVRRVKGR